LADHAEGHKKLAEKLLEREVIFSEDLEEIFGPRPWDSQKGPEKKMEVPMNDNSENKPLTSPPTTSQKDSPKDNKESA
jgi:cell division protease FtsH